MGAKNWREMEGCFELAKRVDVDEDEECVSSNMGRWMSGSIGRPLVVFN